MSQNVIVVTDKHETYVIDASDLDAAHLALFSLFKDNEYYMDLDEPDAWDVDKPSRMKQWYAAAKKGDAKAAKSLLNHRRGLGYEYEDRWRLTLMMDPKRKKK